MRYLTLLLLFSVCFSCTPDDSTENRQIDETSQPAPGVILQPIIEIDGDLSVTPFSSAPTTLTDCNCTLRLEAEERGNTPFLVFDWEGDGGVIGLNGTMIELRRGASLSVGGQAVDSYLHESNQFRVQTRLQLEDENGTCSGSVKVKDKVSGATMKAEVVGMCRC